MRISISPSLFIVMTIAHKLYWVKTKKYTEHSSLESCANRSEWADFWQKTKIFVQVFWSYLKFLRFAFIASNSNFVCTSYHKARASQLEYSHFEFWFTQVLFNKPHCILMSLICKLDFLRVVKGNTFQLGLKFKHS